ncbi:kinase-like domain-containing protein [Mycena rosella]|uniref:non-specific serine/threonine protein kinase n=1 Tax=Mycena rosella TaxID=1033263 RepID=A0AAD7DZZ0_MYCRO|nr:kinase-like domain-containing protein [Mycena rosella]
MLSSRSAGFPAPEMPVTLDGKGCSPSAKASFVPPLLSPQSCSAPQAPQKHGSAKHVLFCITNGPVSLPPAPPPVEEKPRRRMPPKSFKTARRSSDVAIPAPGPFLFLTRVQSGSYGEAVAVRELDSAWLQGVSPGRVLCMKVFNKATSQLRELIPGIVQEVLAYRNLARARARREYEGSGFVMELEASLQDEKRLFFVMELMDCDLLAVFNGYRFPRRENARRWICQMALGLSAIHASGVIHRDIKPENLLLDADGNIRISDFGSAHTEMGAAALDPDKVYASEVTGTWAYMSPEMLANRRKPRSQAVMYGPGVDYWSLGCVAFELVAEEPDVLFNSEEEVRRYLSWHQNGHSSTSYLTFAGLSVDAESLVSGLLAIDPRQRSRAADLRAHPYFQHEDGTSDFEHVIPRAQRVSLPALFPAHLIILPRTPPPDSRRTRRGASARGRASRRAGALA